MEGKTWVEQGERTRVFQQKTPCQKRGVNTKIQVDINLKGQIWELEHGQSDLHLGFSLFRYINKQNQYF